MWTRLALRQLNTADAPFIRELVNEPPWLRFIGDKGVRTDEDARNYILKGPADMYSRLGHGLWLVELKNGNVPIGICGLIKREALDEIDLGFAFLEAHWRKGYAFEAASATLSFAKENLSLRRVVAIMSPDNSASGQLLKKLGFGFERMIRLSNDSPEIKLYAIAL